MVVALTADSIGNGLRRRRSRSMMTDVSSSSHGRRTSATRYSGGAVVFVG